MKYMGGGILVLGGIVLAVWLAVWVMLAGGIIQAVDAWGDNTDKVVWGIVRAVLWELGTIPGILLAAIGVAIASDD